MTDPIQTQVALLIDFENLVYGLQEAEGDDYASHVEPELLVRLAEEYGQVVLASAYADWRSREVNQFQTDLYRLGIDLVHVLAKRQQVRMKNAVDVKMAVDAIETVWTLPHITTFVIVSGDRDFIHVLKALRRHGRIVIGVSPDQVVSEDFAALCDRFVRYSALSGALDPEAGEPRAEAPGIPNLDAVRVVLRALMKERPSGLKGAQIKPLLRSRLSVTFDESEYGYSRLTDMLLAIPDAVRVVSDRRGGDVLVLPPDSAVAQSAAFVSPSLPSLAQRPRARRWLGRPNFATSLSTPIRRAGGPSCVPCIAA